MTTSQPHFRRDLSLWQACALVIGSMIGTGIFFFVSPVAAYLSHPAAILAAWAVGGAMAICGALCLAELAAAYPSTGGLYVYISRACGPYAGFLYTWTKFLVMRVGSLAIPALAFSGFFAEFFALSPIAAATIKKPLSIAVIILLTVFNAMGVRFGGRLQSILTIAKIICLFFIIGAAAVFAAGYVEPRDVSLAGELLSNLPNVQQPMPTFELSFLAALVPILWTFGGWDEPPYVAEEIRNPRRSLPVSIIVGIVSVVVLYVGVNAAYLAILTPSELAASGERTAVYALCRVFGPQSGKIIGFFLMISCLGVLNGMILTGARIAFAAGGEHLFFRWFKQIDSQTKTPQRALLVQGILATLAIVFSDNMMTILLYTGIPYWSFSILMVISLFVLRRRDFAIHRPFKVWGYPYVPIIFMVTSIAMVVVIASEDSHHYIVAGVIFAAGTLAYGLQKLIVSNQGSLLRQIVTFFAGRP